MKKTLSALSLALLPMLAIGASEQATYHGGGHGHKMPNQKMMGRGHHSEQKHHHNNAQHSANDHHHDTSMEGIGQPGIATEVTRTLELVMKDNMRFIPDSIEVKAGETVRLKVVNEGKIDHELVIGEMESLLEHAKEMRMMPNMVHDDPNAITLKPGAKGELIWKFDQAGLVDFACLLPGHFEAGMKGQVKVK